MNSSFRATGATGLAVCLLLLHGCATPIEVKNASQKQLELIDALDNAVRQLTVSVDRFYRDHSDLVRVEGRMQVARSAVIEATRPDGEVSADELFETYGLEVRPWIRHAFARQELEAEIAEVEEQLERESDATQKLLLQRKLNDLRLRESETRGRTPRPETVEAIDANVRGTIDLNAATAADVRRNLNNLRTQISLMKLMQSRVDAWLSIDVSPSQEQIDALTKSIGEAHNALSGDGP